MFRGVPDLTGWVVGVWGVTHVFVRCVSLYVSVGYALSAGPAHTLRLSSYAAARQRGRLVCVLRWERRCRSQDYRVTAVSPLPQGMSLVVFTVSTLGTLGPEAAKLVAALSRRNSGNVPGSLLDAASWACPRLGPFLRQAVGLAARRGLARAVNETYRTVPVAPLLVPAVRVVGPAAAQAYFLEFPALPAAVVP